MAVLDWRQKRKLIYFIIFAGIITVAIVGLVWYFWPNPTCTDNKQNGKEEGIDCGGQCTPCLGEVKDLSVLWVNFFKNQEGFYDAAALIENPNLYAGLASLKYQFKLYDANNVLIVVREGNTFINPGERQVIFESNLSAGSRTPFRAYIEFSQQKDWKYVKKEKPFLSVVKKDFFNFPFPRLSAEIKNDSIFDMKGISVAAVLYDTSDKVQAVSTTKIDLIPAESSQFANFSWPLAFDKEPASIEVIATINLTVNNK